jgi:thiamine transport system permease protein
VIVAHVFYNAPWVALLVAQARRAVPQAPLDAAATLGAGAGARFWFVVWPRLRWALGAASAQVMAVCSMSFALVMILGGGPPVETLETALYSRLRGGALDLGGAAACALWEILLTLAPWGVVLWLRARSGLKLDATGAGQAARTPGGAVAAAVASIAAAVFLVPYSAVFDRSSFSILFTAGFWSEALTPLRLSMTIAALVSVGTLGTAACALLATTHAPRRLSTVLNALLSLPSGLSVLVLGLGGWLAYSRWIDPFEGSLLAIVTLQVVVLFPAAYRLLWPVAQSAQRGAMEAAWSLGASPWRAFWLVDWPRWRAPVRSVVALTAALAVGEVAAVSLFYSEDLVPLPLVVSRWMGQYRFDEARAVAALLLAAAAGLMVGVSMGKGKANAAGI